jgi:hypothetical protein
MDETFRGYPKFCRKGYLLLNKLKVSVKSSYGPYRKEKGRRLEYHGIPGTTVQNP